MHTCPPQLTPPHTHTSRSLLFSTSLLVLRCCTTLIRGMPHSTSTSQDTCLPCGLQKTSTKKHRARKDIDQHRDSLAPAHLPSSVGWFGSLCEIAHPPSQHLCPPLTVHCLRILLPSIRPHLRLVDVSLALCGQQHRSGHPAAPYHRMKR